MMLNASSPSPAADFFTRVNNVNRSASLNYSSAPNSNHGHGGQDEDVPMDQASGNGGGGEEMGGGLAEVRRATSMRVPGAGPYGNMRPGHRNGNAINGMSFGVAGSNLSSPRSTSSGFAAPLASRHALFSHHASPPVQPFGDPKLGPNSDPLNEINLSEISSPPSPSGSVTSSAFSPASAFLSHFSSSGSLRSGPTGSEIASDAQGAQVLDYILGKLVGRGGFSTVRKAHHTVTGEVFACKIVKRDDLSDRSGSLERFEEEIKTWKSLPRHPSILPLLEIHRTSYATFLFTPYLPGGSLLDVLKREDGSEKTARKWFPGVVAAVGVLHEGFNGFAGGMLHGDLKLDNFLVDHAGNVLVADFYMARTLLTPTPTSVPPPQSVHQHQLLGRGRAPRHTSPFPSQTLPNNQQLEGLPTAPFPSASLPYAPPELLRAPPAEPTLAQDIWALGIILHALLTGRLPFFDAFDPRLQMKILRGTYAEPQHLGKEWLECLHGCLDSDKDRRWDIARVRRSDAVTGWQEVKTRRSQSRSRSRQRGPAERPSRMFGDHLRERDGFPSPPSRRGQSRDPSASRMGTASNESLRGGMTSAQRSRSASGSRSRSSGKDRTVFDSTAPGIRHLDIDISQLSVNRGRSKFKGDTSAEASPTLLYPLRSPSHSPAGYKRDSPAGSGSNSRTRESNSRSRSRGGGNRGSSRDTSASRSRATLSPATSFHGSVSRSRSRTITPRDGTPRDDTFGWDHELDVVKEEWKGEEERGRTRGRPER